MIVRADKGGLAAQMMEASRHLRPAAALVVDLGDKGRGPVTDDALRDVAEWAHEVRVTKHLPLSATDIIWLCSRSDTVFTAETAYHDQFHECASMMGARLVVQANPELWRPDYTADVIVNPTCYDQARRDWPILPVPVATDRFTYRPRNEVATTFLHLPAPAMKDRNGTNIVLDAFRQLAPRRPIRLIMPGYGQRWRSNDRNITVECPPMRDNYWENYTDDIDVLLMPRRYAGLCLPAQEAAACGIPTLALDTDPLRRTCITVPHRGSRSVPMQGGIFEVFTCDPRDYAAQMRELMDSRAAVANASARAIEWARSISWSIMEPRYREVLGC